MSDTKAFYEALEHKVLRLDDESDEELANHIRDLMDFVWCKRLSPADRNALNCRISIVSNAI